MPVNDITHPEDLELSPDFFQRSISGEMDNIVYKKRYIHSKGHLVWGQISTSIVRDSEGQPLYFISHVQDITQQKLAEEALKKSEEKFSKLFQASPTYISLATLEEGRFVAVNGAFTRITGYQPNEEIGRTFREIGLWPDPDDREEFIKQIEKYGSQHLQEVTLTRKDGSLIDGLWSVEKFELEGKAHLITMLIDITEKKRAEEALRETEERYRDLYENAPSGYFSVSALDGSILRCNNAASQIFGYAKEALIKMRVFDLYADTPKGKAKAQDIFNRFKSGVSIRDIELQMKHKDGHPIWVSLSVEALRDRDGNIIESRSMVMDISERKRVEAQLQQVQKMETIGTLAGGIAHDFNNLLMAIQGNASLMLLKKDPGHRDYPRLKNIEQYVQSGAELTKQLLGFARGGKYEVNPTDLNELIKKNSEMFGRTKKEIQIHLKYQEGIWTVEVDRGQIEQVLMNLYINAWQVMPGGGNLFIETENVELDRKSVMAYGVDPGKYVKISITDNGVGMDKKTLERIFDPFFTTKEMGKGSGLGLASAYGIIKNHGGIIDVRSKKGEETTFMIYLPASEKEVPREEALPEEVLEGEETILLVDDEDMIIDAGKEMLEEMGYTVLAAESGMEAIDTYREKDDEIDMVILDMIMPEMGGGETYDRLREGDPEIKVLLSSGYSIEGEATEILERGCNGFIQKPFDMKEISRKIREVLDEK